MFVLGNESNSIVCPACGTIKFHSVQRGVPPLTPLISFHSRFSTNRLKMNPVFDESLISLSFCTYCNYFSGFFFPIVEIFYLKQSSTGTVP